VKQQWDPWVRVQTGLVPVESAYPSRVPLKVTTLGSLPAAELDAKAAIRSLMVGLAFAAIAGFHGYRRNNNSVFWGLSWAAGGFVCPVVTLPFAISQGFGRRTK
jgi:hypothetical protein